MSSLFMTSRIRRDGRASGLPRLMNFDHALEDDLVGHLAADRPELDVGAAEIFLELALGLELDVPDEVVPW